MKKQKTALQPIGKPIFGYWQALYRSFYSDRLYVDVAKRWQGFGFLYLCFIVSIFSIPLIINLMFYFNDYYDKQFFEPLSKIPTLYIQNGEVNFDKPMPYLIKGDQGQVLAAIDTTGKITKISEKYPNMTILITKNEIITRIPTPFTKTFADERVQVLSKDMNQVFNGEAWVKSSKLSNLKYFFLVMAPVMILFFFFSMLLVLIPVIAFLGQQFSLVFFRFKLKFKQASRLAIVASTPGMAYAMFSIMTGYIYRGYGFVSMIILFIYFSYGLIYVKRDSQQVARR